MDAASWLAGAGAALDELTDLAGTPRNAAFVADLRRRVGAVAQAAPALKAASAARRSPPAFKSSQSATALLAGPVRAVNRQELDELHAVASEEAGHVAAAAALGFRANFAYASKDAGSVILRPSPTDPTDAACIILAGSMARDPRGTKQAVASGWEGLRRHLSDSDWRALEATLPMADPDSWGRLQNAAVLAAGIVAGHRPAVERVRDGLMRNSRLEEAEIAALVEGA